MLYNCTHMATVGVKGLIRTAILQRTLLPSLGPRGIRNSAREIGASKRVYNTQKVQSQGRCCWKNLADMPQVPKHDTPVASYFRFIYEYILQTQGDMSSIIPTDNCILSRAKTWQLQAMSISLWSTCECVCLFVCTVDRKQLDVNPLTNSVEFIWSTTTVAVGDTAVLHCSFDAIFQQLRSGNVRLSVTGN